MVEKGQVQKCGSFCLCEGLLVTECNMIAGHSVFIYSHRSVCYNSPDECLKGKLKAIESDATCYLILVSG